MFHEGKWQTVSRIKEPLNNVRELWNYKRKHASKAATVSAFQTKQRFIVFEEEKREIRKREKEMGL